MKAKKVVKMMAKKKSNPNGTEIPSKKEALLSRNGKGKLLMKSLTVTLTLLLGAMAIMFISAQMIPQVLTGHERNFGGIAPPRGIPLSEDLESFFALRLLLSVSNVCLILYLLYIHVRDYVELRSDFTLGLVAFLFSFLLYALSSFPIAPLIFGRFGAGVMSFVPMLFSAIGLIIFLKLSTE